MYLEIITPDKKVFEGEVTGAKFPGTQGSFEVLNNHAPLISTLENGESGLPLPPVSRSLTSMVVW